MRTTSTNETIADTDCRIVRIGAEDVGSLNTRAAQVAERPEEAFAPTVVTRFERSQRHRLAIVADSSADLAEKCKLAATHLANQSVRPLFASKGIFYRCAERTRVAFLFPGPGSVYRGMLQQLVSEYSAAAIAARTVDAVSRETGLPTFEELSGRVDAVPQNVRRSESDLPQSLVSLVAASYILNQASLAMGVTPSRVAGHGLGELSALVAAKSISLRDALSLSRELGSAVAACPNAIGSMLTTPAPVELLESWRHDLGLPMLALQADGLGQTIVVADDVTIKDISARLATHNHFCRRIDAAAAFYTPLMEDVVGSFRRSIAEISIQPPSVPFLSSLTGRFLAEPEEIRESLVAQLAQPVNYEQLLSRLTADGTKTLVEVGPGVALTQHHDRVLSEKGVVSIYCDHPQRAGLRQLLYARACVETTGALDEGAVDQRLRFRTTIESPSLQYAQSATVDVSGVTGAAKAIEEVDSTAIETGLHLLRLVGSPYEMGLEQGRSQAEQIRWMINDKGESSSVAAEALTQAETYFGPDELEELRGIAEGAGVAFSGILGQNVRLFLDAGSGGMHFGVTAACNRHAAGLVHAANEDLRAALPIRDQLRHYMLLKSPQGGIPYLTFGIAGQVGGRNGMNVRGVGVTTSTLLDVDSDKSLGEGRLLTVLVKNILESCDTVRSALEVIRSSSCCSPYSLLLSDHSPVAERSAGSGSQQLLLEEERLCYVEFDGNDLKVQPAPASVLACNHRSMRTFAGEPPKASRNRAERLKMLLGDESSLCVDESLAQSVLRDRFDMRRQRALASSTMGTLCRADNQFSVVMQPALRRLWVTTGAAGGERDDFRLLTLDELFPGISVFASAGPVATVGSASMERAAASEADSKSTSMPGASGVASLPLIDAVAEITPSERLVAEVRLDPINDVFLVEHRYKGVPMMPVVVTIEALAEAAALLYGGARRVVALRDVEIVDGLRIFSEQPQLAKVHAVANGDGEVACEFTSEFRNRRGQVLLKDKTYLRSVVELAEAAPCFGLKPPPQPEVWGNTWYSQRDMQISHGPVFQSLRHLASVGEDDWGRMVTGRVEDLAGRRQGDGWITSPAALDACFFACGSFVWFKYGVVAIPKKIERVSFGRLPWPGETCLVHLRCRAKNDQGAIYDFTLYGEDDTVLIQLVGYHNIIVAEVPADAR